MTAGGTHVTVLLDEAVESLAIKAEGVYMDGTFGRGGHSRLILSKLGKNGRLVAVDRDLHAIAAGAAIKDSRFQLVHRAFGDIAEAASEAGLQAVDGILFDVGVSSPQIDDGERGFSFRHDAPLDMRMDVTQGETAAEWLARAEIRDITEVIRNYGEERFAFQIAKKIVAARSERPLTTTGQLAALVREAVRTREPGQDPATRTFQALRIHVNQELEQLALVLPQALDVLNVGGRLVVISFHSLEDRIVKRFINRHAKAPPANRRLPELDVFVPTLRAIGDAQRAESEETSFNPRARSAVLRVAEKLELAA